MLIGGVAINSSNTSVLITAPGGMTERWDLGGKREEYDDAPQASQGSSGDKTWGFSAAREGAGWLAALTPASGTMSLVAAREYTRVSAAVSSGASTGVSTGVSTGADAMLSCDMDAMRSDVTGDGYWNSADIAAVLGLFGQAVEKGTRADIHPSTPDGIVDISDLAMIAGQVGSSPPIVSSEP
jgi:hypothetical protein